MGHARVRCDYCYTKPQHDAGMSSEVGLQTLELATKLNESDDCGIVFFGGEPLLKEPLIRQLVGEAKRKLEVDGTRFVFKMTTNGLLLDDDFLDFSVENDILVSLSIDGVGAAHDRHRRSIDGVATFDRVLPRFRALLARRPYASVLMTLNPDTVPEFFDSVCFLIDEGCRYLVVSLNYTAPWTETDLAALERQYERLADQYIEWSRAGRKFFFSPFDVKISSHLAGDRVCEEHCELGMRQIAIDPSGYLYPCNQFVSAGADSEWQIGDVWRGIDEDRRTALRDRSFQEQPECGECALRKRCHNTCGCVNWQTTGEISGVSPVLCRHEQMTIRIGDGVAETLFAERSPYFFQKHYNRAYPLLSLLEDRASEISGADDL